MRILIVEDEKDLLESIAEGLRIDGYLVDICDNGEDAYWLADTEDYDLIILDLNLPKMDGMDVLKEIRKTDQEVKILLLTARSHIRDKVKAFDLGATDYLTKPFHFEELEARIRSLLRRKFIQENTLLICGKVHMDSSARIAYADGIKMELTRKELGLLEYFLMNQDKVISQEELMDHVWDKSVNSFSNAVRVHMASLRKKIKAVLEYDPIQTRIGEGYMISERSAQ